MFEFGLPLFPFDSTAITITTTVWIGVCIAVFFNLRFGWTLSGLVIPGYLVPLLLTRPIAAAVILIEAMLTYWIVVAISEWPRKLAYWSSFFGRDRFFAILVVSVLVRAILDGWILPYVGHIIVEDYGINFDYRNNLQSFGLIAVALIANYFWKPGVLKGLIPLLTIVGLTFLVIRYPLIQLTNFNVGNFHLLYEDISTSLLASPKAYIIVLMTAYLASCFNLRYAWDFNGILIPALLGLLWHQPIKIVFSSLECILILGIASYLLRTPLFRKVTVEGGRKLLFFFTICFAYRMLLCHLLPLVAPSAELSDTFGFGYLLSTLMAVKAHDKRLVVRMIRSITEVSMLGAVVGSLIGFAFYCGPEIHFRWSQSNRGVAAADTNCRILFEPKPLLEVVRADKVRLYEKQKPESYLPPVPYECSAFRTALQDLRDFVAAGGIEKLNGRPESESRSAWCSSDLNRIAQQLSAINYETLVVRDRYVYLREKSPTHGWGIYVVDTKASDDGLCIEIPAPLEEKATIESGLCLFHNFEANAVAIAGAPMNANITGSADVTRANDTLFREFHDVFGRRNPLQIRGLSDPKTSTSQSSSQLWLTGSIPRALKIRKLKSLMGSYHVNWNIRTPSNQLRKHSPLRFAELVLSQEDRRELIGHLFRTNLDQVTSTTQSSPSPVVIRDSLRDWLSRIKERACQQGSDLYQPATVEQMLYMDHEVVTPLLELAVTIQPQMKQDDEFWEDPNFQSRWLPIQSAAEGIGYDIVIIDDTQTGDPYFALVESELSLPIQHSSKGWGTFVIRPGLMQPFAVEIPRPLFERRSFEFGVNLFERPKGSALLIAGAHPFANTDGSADISKVGNKTNLFNLFRHVLLREFPQRPMLLTQARAIQAPVDADVVVATDDGTSRIGLLTPLKKKLLAQLSEDRLDFAFVNGRYETAGYELGILMQATAVQVSLHKEVISLWLSPSLRTKFREQTDNNSLAAQFEICELPSIQCGLVEHFLQFVDGTETSFKNDSENQTGLEQKVVQFVSSHTNHLPQGSLRGELQRQYTAIPDSMRKLLRGYVDNFDVLKLLQVKRDYPDWNFVRLVDGVSGQAFLLITRHPDEIPTVLNLTGFVSDRSFRFDQIKVETINAFIRSRALWLEPISEDVSSNGETVPPPVEEVRQ